MQQKYWDQLENFGPGKIKILVMGLGPLCRSLGRTVIEKNSAEEVSRVGLYTKDHQTENFPFNGK
jgi:hypothetical protein